MIRCLKLRHKPEILKENVITGKYVDDDEDILKETDFFSNVSRNDTFSY